MQRVKKLITIGKDIQPGEPVFNGTRTPTYTLFEFLFYGYPLEKYLVNFPPVSKKTGTGSNSDCGKISDIKETGFRSQSSY
jgi:hypothetical protein